MAWTQDISPTCGCCTGFEDCTDPSGTIQIPDTLRMTITAVRPDPSRTAPIPPQAPFPSPSTWFYVGLSTLMSPRITVGGVSTDIIYDTTEWRLAHEPNIVSVGAVDPGAYNDDDDCTIEEVTARFESQIESWKYRNVSGGFQEWAYIGPKEPGPGNGSNGGSVDIFRSGVGSDLTVQIGLTLSSVMRLRFPGDDGGGSGGPRFCAADFPFGAGFGKGVTIVKDECKAVGEYVVGSHTLIRLGAPYADEVDVTIAAA